MFVVRVGYQKRAMSCVLTKQEHEYAVHTAMCAGQLRPDVERQCNLTACER